MIKKNITVIAPVSSDNNYYPKMEIIKKICDSNNIDVIFPNYDKENPKFDINKYIYYISRTNLIIADLSFERPSCYYELGIVEALKKNVKLIALYDTEIHQTSYRKDVLFYKSNSDYRNLLSKLINSANNIKGSASLI